MFAQPFFFRPIFLLRTEAFCSLLAACAAYHLLFPHHWLRFACLIFAPDLSLMLYARGPNAAASMGYNMIHSYILPALVGGLALHLKSPLLGEICLIWISHIGLDRLLGYGLKYPTSFKFTHLQSAANPAAEPAVLSHSA